MEVALDGDRCIGSGMCVLSAPAVFDQSDEGTGVVLDRHPGAEQLAAVREAVAVCPAAAIAIVGDRPAR
ncbi:ferredoxin [Nonomuraea sp. NPDC050790]|uniref:ferredoxin n=1 Tax=Nonomuraea sp. NPDC050790 TaxID=3364371 RepID=UPI0037ACF437